MTVDGYATQPHYVHPHISSLMRALPPGRRGAVYVESNANEFRRYGYRGDVLVRNGKPPVAGHDPVLIAGGADLQYNFGRPVVFVEHGAGQAYLGADLSTYSGGPGRDQVSLFLCPNRWSAARNSARYPKARVEIVGAAHLERAVRVGPVRASPVIAVTFHWDGSSVAPEAGSGWDYWGPHVLALAGTHTVLGHAHPRAASTILPWWEANGVQATDDPYAVLALADVLIAENTSMLYEAARLDIPVVVLDCPYMRRDVDHGPPRFWSHADVGIRVGDPDELAYAVDVALKDPPEVAARRRALAYDVYPWIGDEAAARAVRAILDLCGGRSDDVSG